MHTSFGKWGTFLGEEGGYTREGAIEKKNKGVKKCFEKNENENFEREREREKKNRKRFNFFFLLLFLRNVVERRVDRGPAVDGPHHHVVREDRGAAAAAGL